MQAEITTIPELMLKYRWNLTEIGRQINTTRDTVRKYVNDVKAENHVVINGRLMTKHKGAKVIE